MNTASCFSETHVIRIRGTRVHNLKNLDVDLPRDQLIVITGPSGSGKSSLAFDTLFAEGQRQYLDSLSVYARQFLHQLERPDVDLIDGLQPTICIDQRPGNQNPRSTVATVTEIYDYLRVLAARLGIPHCYQCGTAIRQQTPDQIHERLMRLPEGTKLMLLAPLVRGRRGTHKEVASSIRKAGFVRARINGEIVDIEQFPELSPRKVHHIEAVVDRIIIRPAIRGRLAESLRLAMRHGEDLVIACYLDESSSGQPTWRDELFSALYACPNCEISYEELEPRTFSFNSPYGACPECDGLGMRTQFDLDRVLPNRELSLQDGVVEPWRGARNAAVKKAEAKVREYLETKGYAVDTPWNEIKPNHFEQLLDGVTKKYPGLLNLLENEWATSTSSARQQKLESFRRALPCHACLGSRLRPEAMTVELGGRKVADLVRLSVADARRFFAELRFEGDTEAIGKPLLAEITRRLEFMKHVGVDYLTLDRPADTLSGGELQRVRLATCIGSGLVGVCYVLDEPSIGLHPRDNQRLIASLRDLQQQGNTVVVVEHDEAMMREADRLIDIGPGAGMHGGTLVAEGSPAEVIAEAESLTGKYLRGEATIAVPNPRRPFNKSRSLVLEGATTNNLQDVTARIPLGALVCITGVSGSGKSSLIHETLVPAVSLKLGNTAATPGEYRGLKGTHWIDKIIEIDQAPIGRTPRSNPATYIGAFDEIRKLFARTKEAKARGYRANRFSFNVKAGRCEACQGQGVQKIEMNFLPDLYVTCEQCSGARFNRQTLQITYKGKNIADILDLPIEEALRFFENIESIQRALKCLTDVGLGYLKLGQPSTTLSGGEAQRVKLATELARSETGKTLYVLDEPTTGLHFDDIRKLLDILHQLVERGNTVIVIEHHLDVIKTADWILDLGPAGGSAGGRIVAEGPPEQVAQVAGSETGKCLAEFL